MEVGRGKLPTFEWFPLPIQQGSSGVLNAAAGEKKIDMEDANRVKQRPPDFTGFLTICRDQQIGNQIEHNV
jgi:hypothetical protein